MKTDRELLELAAKAAGFSTWDFLAGEEGNLMNVYTDDGTHSTWWPLEDDGDALRLAHALGMQLNLDECNDMNDVRTDIVMAAAAIGEQK